MKQSILWRDEVHGKKVLHPLILACHSFIYFESIHPFIGRMNNETIPVPLERVTTKSSL
jgi:hypothetical protein